MPNMYDIIDLISSDASSSLHHNKFYLSTPSSSSSSSSSLSSISDEEDELDVVEIIDLSSDGLLSFPNQVSQKSSFSISSRGSRSTNLILRRINYKERSKNLRLVLFLIMTP